MSVSPRGGHSIPGAAESSSSSSSVWKRWLSVSSFGRPAQLSGYEHIAWESGTFLFSPSPANGSPLRDGGASRALHASAPAFAVAVTRSSAASAPPHVCQEETVTADEIAAEPLSLSLGANAAQLCLGPEEGTSSTAGVSPCAFGAMRGGPHPGGSVTSCQVADSAAS
eukprot:jgi/Mesen1/8961/ME000056S08370